MVEDLRDLIALKRDGGALDDDAIDRFVRAAASGSAPEVHLAAMLMAIFCRGLTDAERTRYALAMMRSGVTLSWDHLDRVTVDKHSTGGVGDKISLIWGPLMAAVGYAVPMISGRGLGHTGGTLDKLESIPGYRTDLSAAEMDAVLRATGCVITGQTGDLVPADRRLYDLRSRTATVPTVDHIAPSIMSKKLAEGAAILVLDVKVGRGAFMQTRDDARRLAEVMVAIGVGAGRRTVAWLTDMDAPLGRAIGNAAEVAESVEVLRGGGPADVRELTLVLAEAALEADGVPDSRPRLERALDDGSALAVLEAMVTAQGGDAASLHDPGLLRGAGLPEVVLAADRSGFVQALDALDLGQAVNLLGGGRGPDGTPPHPGVAGWLEVAVGDPVVAGQPLLRLLHAGTGVEAAIARARRGIRVGDAPAARPLLLERVG